MIARDETRELVNMTIANLPEKYRTVLERKYIEEVGTMNIFFKFGDEVVTSPLTGSILPGVTRDSVIKLLGEWGNCPPPHVLRAMAVAPPIDLSSIRSFGLYILDGIDGPFRLEVDVKVLRQRHHAMFGDRIERVGAAADQTGD